MLLGFGSTVEKEKNKTKQKQNTNTKNPTSLPKMQMISEVRNSLTPLLQVNPINTRHLDKINILKAGGQRLVRFSLRKD